MYSYIQIEENITYFRLPFSNEKVHIVGGSLYELKASVNRGAGYGLEVPCEYQFEGDNFLCNWLKEKLVKDPFDFQC